MPEFYLYQFHVPCLADRAWNDMIHIRFCRCPCSWMVNSRDSDQLGSSSQWSLSLNTERAYIWSLRVSTCQSSLFSKHFIGWKTLKVVQSSAWLIVRAALPAKSDFMLLWDDLFNYCRAGLQSHLPDNYLANSFDTWLCLHPFCSKNYLNC